MHAIPTKYNGRTYRSRLEARWAAMFELLKWNVEYEPIDFNGWIPDFVIKGAEEVFVEIKPTAVFPYDAANKINKSGCLSEVLMLGYSIPIQDTYANDLYFGWLREYTGEDNHKANECWEPASFGIWLGQDRVVGNGRVVTGNPNNAIGFCNTVQSFRDRITGFYDGGCYGARIDKALPEVINSYWCEAANLVQWHKQNA